VKKNVEPGGTKKCYRSRKIAVIYPGFSGVPKGTIWGADDFSSMNSLRKRRTKKRRTRRGSDRSHGILIIPPEINHTGAPGGCRWAKRYGKEEQLVNKRGGASRGIEEWLISSPFSPLRQLSGTRKGHRGHCREICG